MMLERLREDVCAANKALLTEGLVTWTSGNVSGRDPDTGLVTIKPSGVMFQDLNPASMVVLTLDGEQVDGDLPPSSDTAAHLWVYRHRDDIGGMTHTHSNYATAFAAIGQPIPCCLTGIADEFGADIPLGDYASIGGDEIGREIIRSIGDSPAILMRQHGVFTIGPTVQKALKAAVMVEDVAKTVSIAMTMGTVERLSDEEIAVNYLRYTTRYGTFAASELP